MSTSPSLVCHTKRLFLCLIGLLFLHVSAFGQAPDRANSVPSAEEIAALLTKEPISLVTWPAWRARLLDWIGDTGHQTDQAYKSAWAFMQEQAKRNDQLPEPLAQDAFAWYLLGSALLHEEGGPGEPANPGARAEAALRRSLALDPRFARAHRNLAIALARQSKPSARAGGPKNVVVGQLLDAKLQEAQRELEEARRLDPKLRLHFEHGLLALYQSQFAMAEMHFGLALADDPREVQLAYMQALAIVQNESSTSPRAPRMKSLLDQFGEDGTLVCYYGAALAQDGDPRAAAREFEHARRLGADPSKFFSPEAVKEIEEAGAPSSLERLAWIMGYFAAFYGLVMVLMAAFGFVLAGRTRGNRALELLGDDSESLVTSGQVARSGHESWLARLYSLALFAGLILFYGMIPFTIVGLIALTGLLLYVIFMLPRIPVKLIVLVVVVGLGGAWAVLKSVFARPGKGSFGLPKSATDCPRLYGVLSEVAGRVDTDPVDQVYIAPGSGVGVHQEGRGPFGIFGVKKRVLTLGLSAMNFLTVSELESILAHEYAHFSHKDTFYNRFIYQVQLSIQEALNGMGASGGKLNYVNPFFWLLYLYYKSYNLLASGYSRSREFLADRMAATLYGSDVFASALTKVSTDGVLFEMTIYDNIGNLLSEGKAFVNMYSAFRSYRDEQLNAKDREELYQKLLDEKESLFASHPTFKERIDAVAPFPRAQKTDSAPALQLFENPDEMEKELTDFLTGYVSYLRQLQAQAAQEQ